jgi:hypothetical protein
MKRALRFRDLSPQALCVFSPITAFRSKKENRFE